jgi:acyl-CoA synthetase (AMP-forming)/AMP-acid ligase II
VVLRDGYDVKPRELMTTARTVIADFKVPSRYEFVDTLPRSPTGKILRRDLREQFWAHLDRHV